MTFCMPRAKPVQPSDRESDSFWPKVRRTGTVGRVDLDLAQIEIHGRIPDLHILVAQAALNGLDLIAHVGQPLLKRDERLHVLALREHIE